LAGAGGAWYGYREFNRLNKDLATARPDFVLTASELTREYEMDEQTAGKKFNGKIVEVSGKVRRVEKDEKGFYTVVLGDSGLSSVRCAIDTNHNSDAAILKPGTSTTIRGACTGYYKDDLGLGSDAILNRCAVVHKKN
jgi:hypothetical protein